MKRIAVMAVAALVILGVASVSQLGADKNAEGAASTQPQLIEAPAPSELKSKEGVLEGQTSPLELAKTAIAAAKADELGNLKKLFSKQCIDYVDDEDWSVAGDKKPSYLQAVGAILKGWSPENLKQLDQSTLGNFAVVIAKNGEKVHVIKCVREAPEDADESGGKKTKSWHLINYQAREYRIDYNSPGVKTIRDAVTAGDNAKIKESINEWNRQGLELLDGVQEGVSSYGLLGKRIQKIMGNAEAPVMLFSRYGSQVAYWFHSDSADTFLVLSFMEDYVDGWSGPKYTKVEIEIDQTASFHADAGDQFKSFVNDYDWD